MRHNMGLHGGQAVLIIAAIVAAGALIVLAVLLFSRAGRPRDRGATDEGASADPVPLQGQVLALLRQKGGPVSQGGLCRQLNGEPREVARALHRLEEAQLIERYWQPGRSDYAVLLAEK